MAYWLRRWIPKSGVPGSKPIGGSKVDSAFDPSGFHRMSTKKSWVLYGKK